ncbi:MAG: hypothetical protein CL814_12490 [Confluentimicrobium sp.]|jgi:hypothetical protein|uniref:PepSY domain-containing protein n=1 Tax=Actibacterium sp. TaxID=1872125 RepID=UPI000C551FD7|nr:PepSY domain-containing protein [Actibacterium sp.]MBC57737.1 hypothetical protein [Actibacterium sp.]MDY6858380.1 PepSY domain-containing protein [Pseudomonadota bacterium]|tara:strand:- start:1588 stop:1899 length:312 start_codon:yes stop_codon:yes gene_type:complete
MSFPTFRTITLTAAATLVAGAALASGAERSRGETAGQARSGYTEQMRHENTERVRTRLKADGYELRKLEQEDGRFEAYALKNGKRFELYLDKGLNILRSKADD